MPFDSPETTKKAGSPQKKVAVIGSGISGLSAAWLLDKSCDVTIYESQDRLGGHTNTTEIEVDGEIFPVDTGFIVFNEPSYPNFTQFLRSLGAPSEASCMSFGVSMNDGAFEYSGQTLSSVFTQRRNIASIQFWTMLYDIPKFHKAAKRAVRFGENADQTLGEFVGQEKFSATFCEFFLKPMAAAIWSTPQVKIFDYPALPFFQFFENHGLLQIFNLPEWRTIKGGSRTYVKQILKQFTGEIRTSCGVKNIFRSSEGVIVTDCNGVSEIFEDVVIAAHADDAITMLENVERREKNILCKFLYQPNHAVLHCDPNQMPVRRSAWSSWNYMGSGENGSVSYWMNRLQNLECNKDIIVTLNPRKKIAPEKIYAEFDYSHPMFNLETYASQREIWNIQGNGGVWFAGAHLGHGFHEDGIQSGLAVAEMIGGVLRPWTVKNANGRLQLNEPLQVAV